MILKFPGGIQSQDLRQAQGLGDSRAGGTLRSERSTESLCLVLPTSVIGWCWIDGGDCEIKKVAAVGPEGQNKLVFLYPKVATSIGVIIQSLLSIRLKETLSPSGISGILGFQFWDFRIPICGDHTISDQRGARVDTNSR